MRNNQILLAKLEATEGVDATPDGANVIETVDGIDTTVYDGEKVTRNVDSAVPSPGTEVNKSPHQTFSFNVDAAGSGVAGTAPAFGPLLEACGFTMTEDAGVSVTYSLSHQLSKTVTLARYVGNDMIQKALGCRGNLSLSMESFIRMQFSNFKGSYIQPTQGGFPSPLTYDNYASPLPINKSNTGTLDLDGQPLAVTGGSISFGDGVNYKNLPNQEFSQHGNQFATGQMTFIAPDLATKNFFAKMESHNGVELLPWNLVHGAVSGNIIELASTSVQLSNLSETDIDGDVGFQADLRFMSAPDLVIK